jgi:hypothetical protein
MGSFGELAAAIRYVKGRMVHLGSDLDSQHLSKDLTANVKCRDLTPTNHQRTIGLAVLDDRLIVLLL